MAGQLLGSCGNCANGDLSVEELTEARIEFVKQQILKKLRMSKKPAVALPVKSLPMPVAQGQTLSEGTDKPSELDDYYGRTEQKIIFPTEGEFLFLFKGFVSKVEKRLFTVIQFRMFMSRGYYYK